MSRIRIENLRNPVTKEDFESRENVTKGYMGLWFFFDEKKTLIFDVGFSLIFQGVVIWGNMREFTYISFLTNTVEGIRVTNFIPSKEQLSKVCKEIIFYDSSKEDTVYTTLSWYEFLKRTSTTTIRRI